MLEFVTAKVGTQDAIITETLGREGTPLFFTNYREPGTI